MPLPSRPTYPFQRSVSCQNLKYCHRFYDHNAQIASILSTVYLRITANIIYDFPAMNVQIIFGTASFGMDLTEFQDSPSVRSLLEELRNLGVSRLDSGARYPPLMPGRAEELIGESDDISGSFLIDTKVYADTKTDGSGELTSEAVERSILASLQRLQKPNGVRPTLIYNSCLPQSPVTDAARR